MAFSEAFTTSDNQLWTTPWPVIDALRPEFRFTLDAAACKLSTKAPVFYSEKENAFTQDWAKDAGDGDAWCNPPYGQYLGKRVGDWVQKGWEESRKGLNVVFLLPINKGDQDWYHDLAVPYAEIRPVKGRIHFVDPTTGKQPLVWSKIKQEWVKNGNSQGSNLIIFGPTYKPCAPRSFIFER